MPIRMLRCRTKRSIRYRYPLYSYSPSNSRMTSHHFPPIHQCLCRIALIRELIAPGSAQSLLLVSTLDQKKFNFFVPSNITSHYTCYCSILKAIFMLAEERSATFSRHSKLCNHPSYLKNGSSVFHTISILSSPLIITFLIIFWIFSLSKDSILMILSNCVSNLLEELSSGGISVLSCSIS